MAATAQAVELAPTGSSLFMALVVGALFAAGVYLLLQRPLTRVLIGLGILTHAANLLLLVSGGLAGEPPFVGEDGAVPAGVADPLPQAMALTAIVIAFAVSALLLGVAYRSYVLTRDDIVQDDVEDSRIARLADPPDDPPDDPTAGPSATRSPDRADARLDGEERP